MLYFNTNVGATLDSAGRESRGRRRVLAAHARSGGLIPAASLLSLSTPCQRLIDNSPSLSDTNLSSCL